MALLLDTHIWIWLTDSDKRLAHSASPIAKSLWGELHVSAMSVWEIAMLVQYKRLVLDRTVRAWIQESVEKQGIQIIPVNGDIALESCSLPEPFHKDPADRMIVATARIKGLKLITQDKALLAYAKKGYVNAA